MNHPQDATLLFGHLGSLNKPGVEHLQTFKPSPKRRHHEGSNEFVITSLTHKPDSTVVLPGRGSD